MKMFACPVTHSKEIVELEFNLCSLNRVHALSHWTALSIKSTRLTDPFYNYLLSEYNERMVTDTGIKGEIKSTEL